MNSQRKPRVCSICGGLIPETRTSNNLKYCSTDCARTAQAQKQSKRIANRAKRINVIAQLAYRAYGYKCALCGWQATKDTISFKGKIQYAHGNELHHIIPIAEGGTETADNIILLCPNHHKQAGLGLIARSQLQKHTVGFELTEDQKREAKARCAEVIANAIFGM